MVRTRFAPSPTGMLHIGAIRTALFCYAWAKTNKGNFIVRIEDTDQKRFVENSIDEIFDMLHAYGLNADESIRKEGEFGPYIQSERKNIYLEYAKKLISTGNAYFCFLTEEELSVLQIKSKGRGFRSPYRDYSIEESEKLINLGKSYVIRLKVPNDKEIEFLDGIHGKIIFDSNNVNDEILIKSNGMASYHLAVCVDDYLMKVSHVFRGIEWLPSTPKQILIHKFLNIEMPPYFHLPVILDPEGGKLSKRKGSVSARGFIVDGYLPEAMLNFLMLLGWSAPIKREFGEKEREIFSLDEFIEIFDLKDFNKSNSVFNREKLNWFNKEWIKKLSLDDLTQNFKKWLELYSTNNLKTEIMSDVSLKSKIFLVKERATTLKDIENSLGFFFKKPESIDWSIKQIDNVRNSIIEIKKELLNLHLSLGNNPIEWNRTDWENGVRAIGDRFSVKHGDIFMVLRMAIVGQPYSPPLYEALQLMDINEISERLDS